MTVPRPTKTDMHMFSSARVPRAAIRPWRALRDAPSIQLFDEQDAATKIRRPAGEHAAVVIVPNSSTPQAANRAQPVPSTITLGDEQHTATWAAQRPRYVLVPLLDLADIDRRRRAEDHDAWAKRAAAAAALMAAEAPAETAVNTPTMSWAPPPQRQQSTSPSTCNADSSRLLSAAVYAGSGALPMMPPAHAVMRRGSIAA